MSNGGGAGAPPPAGRRSRAAGVRLIAVICAAEVLSMAGSTTFPALLPTFVAVWDLTNAEAGWLSGVYFAGYVAAVPVLVSLTDREDARRIYLASTLVIAVAWLAFALLAGGFWTAMVCQILGGIGLAGTYMVGLRMLTDRVGGGRQQSRGVAWYTAHFSIGTSVSVLVAGEAADLFGWQAAFLAAAGGGLLAFVLVFALVPAAGPPAREESHGSVFDPRPVIRNRPALAYILGYAAHVWELFGFRAWVVAFLTFALGAGAMETGLEGGSAGGWALKPTQAATAILLLGLPASILGNELAIRFGRRRLVTAVMLASGTMALGVGWLSGLPPAWLVAILAVYGVVIMADSSALTAGAVAAAQPARKGATMALHAFLGFGAGTVSPLAFGLVLDLAGGARDGAAWGLAFGLMGLGVLLGPLAVRWFGRGPAGS